MSKFQERISMLRKAQKAESALEWFDEHANMLIGAISINASVNGYATPSGSAAHDYIHQAARNMITAIAEEAVRLAREDIKRGEEVL